MRLARTQGSLWQRGDDALLGRRVYLPLQHFIQTEWLGGALLFAATVTALVWANSPWAENYHTLWEIRLTIDVGLVTISESLHHWINEGLMAVFFFVVGLEIKRELLHGALSSVRGAALPVVAAIGGMVVPPLLYLALNGSGPTARGWAIPMATDIAFVMGALGLLGQRAPSGLRVLLLALAIVDDLGAILVIALFYSAGISVTPLLWAGVFLTMTWALRRVGVRAHFVHAALGFLAWMAVFSSGLHATLTGVALAAATPAGHRVGGTRFAQASRALLAELEAARERGDHEGAHGALGALEELVIGTEAPLERLERHAHPWSSYLVLPLFALANAGIGLSWASLEGAAGSRVALGIALGLVAGKAIGVAGACWLALRSRLVELGSGLTMSHLLGGGFLTGIGFTVALFIAELAFEGSPFLAEAKIGILAGSLVAALLGVAVLGLLAPTTDALSEPPSPGL